MAQKLEFIPAGIAIDVVDIDNRIIDEIPEENPVWVRVTVSGNLEKGTSKYTITKADLESWRRRDFRTLHEKVEVMALENVIIVGSRGFDRKEIGFDIPGDVAEIQFNDPNITFILKVVINEKQNDDTNRDGDNSYRGNNHDGLRPGEYSVTSVYNNNVITAADRATEVARLEHSAPSGEQLMASDHFIVTGRTLDVRINPSRPASTSDSTLWRNIRSGAEALSFNNYNDFMHTIFCGGRFSNNNNTISQITEELNNRRFLPFVDTDAYRSIKIATEAFVMVNLATRGTMSNSYLKHFPTSLGRNVSMIPYLAIIRQKLSDVDFKFRTLDQSLSDFIQNNKNNQDLRDCYGLITHDLERPVFLELIWSYWHEEAMLVQGMNAICRRFQNIRSAAAKDPLAHLEVGPLRPLNNLLWGYVQDEQHRLTVKRRAYEYDHHYGLTLQGKAVQGLRPADTRSKFIEAFHNLLNITSRYYKQHDDTTIVADAFPVLNALKEVHLILSEGAHNQYGDMPSTARIEMLMQQYLLARPEFREFLPSRQMVAYTEPWMDRTSTLNSLMGWTPTSVMHFRDLGYFGEQILLSIRFGAWTQVFSPANAANWAIFWRADIQNYIHSYRAVTGIDLSNEMIPVDYNQPSVHLMRVLKEQVRKSA